MSAIVRIDGLLRARMQALNTGALLPCEGRLTLTSGVPVMTADATAQGTVYWCPYIGQGYPWYSGSIWMVRSTPQLSLTLSASAHLTGKLYDLFLTYVGGVDLLVTGPAWTSNTARATAISQKGGIYTNTASMTAQTSSGTLTVPAGQGTYVGTMYATANGQCSMAMNPAGASGGSAATLGLWNMYHRRLISGTTMDTGAAYTYASATLRQARNSSGNQVNFVCGLAEDEVLATQVCQVTTPAVQGAFARVAVGLDSTSVATGPNIIKGTAPNAFALNYDTTGVVQFAPQIGYHFIATQQNGDGTNAATFDRVGSDALSVAILA